ncbi:hypothetical protein PV05_11304 [Exophiala xenobiotica]|uniref:Uncharacterized protein n=1 Tax=Exophiala xenobiotica TaxID=348802 RepID=A0A0D2EP99_9EURO|nr:uncharacterized protein PV05_11304 [Exophiala xenobiotica]KIW49639.1 hypothetical protein PV05_11304 [Exophiala xenobiotica]
MDDLRISIVLEHAQCLTPTPTRTFASIQILLVRHSILLLSSYRLCDEWHWAPTVKTWLVLMEKPYRGRPRKPRPLILVTLLHFCSTSSHRTRLSFQTGPNKDGILHSVTCMLLLIVCETTSGSSPSNMMNRHISKTSICPS